MGKYLLKNIALFSALAAALLGCEMVQEVDLPQHEPKLSLRIALNNKPPGSGLYQENIYNQLFVGRSQGVLESEEDLKGVADATVGLYNEAGQLVEVYRHEGIRFTQFFGTTVTFAGYYGPTLDFEAVPGERYTIKASAPGFAPIEGTVQMPAVPAIAAATFEGAEVQEFGNRKYIDGRLQVTIADNPQERNYYRVMAFSLDSADNRIDYYPLSTQRDADTPIDTEDRLWLNEEFSDELYTSGQIVVLNRIHLYEQVIRSRNVRPFAVEVLVQQLTQDEYLYHKTFDAWRYSRDNPFSEYVQVHQNIRNGYGLIGGVSTARQVLPVR